MSFSMLELLKKLWLARIDDEDIPVDDPAPDDEAPPVDEPADDIPIDEPADPDTDDEPAPRARTPREVDELRERTRRLEAEIESERAARRQLTPTAEQAAWDREQRLLDDPNTSAQDRHAIETNRALRQSHAMSAAAQARAEDLADMAEYNLQAMEKPIYRQYRERVEAERTRIAQNGRGVPPRETVLAVLIGKDVLSGKLSKATANKPKVARQKPALPRSDVRANAGRSDREKRRARLQDLVI